MDNSIKKYQDTVTFIDCYDAEIRKILGLVYSFNNICNNGSREELYKSIFEYYKNIVKLLEQGLERDIINSKSGIIYFIFENYNNFGKNSFENLNINYFDNMANTEIFTNVLILRGKRYDSFLGAKILFSDYIGQKNKEIIFTRDNIKLTTNLSSDSETNISYSDINLFRDVSLSNDSKIKKIILFNNLTDLTNKINDNDSKERIIKASTEIIQPQININNLIIDNDNIVFVYENLNNYNNNEPFVELPEVWKMDYIIKIFNNILQTNVIVFKNNEIKGKIDFSASKLMEINIIKGSITKIHAKFLTNNASINDLYFLNKYNIPQSYYLFENFCSYREFKNHIKYVANKKNQYDFDILLYELNSLLFYSKSQKLNFEQNFNKKNFSNKILNSFNTN